MPYQPPIHPDRVALYAPPPLPPMVRLESASPTGLQLERLGIQSETETVIQKYQGEIIAIEEGDYVSVDVPIVTPNDTHFVEQTYTLVDGTLQVVPDDEGGYTAEDLAALEEVRRGHNLAQEEIAALVAESARQHAEAIYGQPLVETSTYFAPFSESSPTPVEDVFVVPETVASLPEEDEGNSEGDNPNNGGGE